MSEEQRNIRLLVVDDDQNMIKLIKFYLIKNNFDIVPASNGKEALEILQNQTFELILIDILMPEMDGQTLLKKIKDELKIDTPVIIVTAHGATDKLMETIKDGAYDILQKPFTTNRLKLTLSNALKYKALKDKLKKLEKSK